MHAVGGRAIDTIQPLGDLAHAQRPLQRERVACPAAVAVGRDRDDIVTDLGEGAAQGRQPGRVTAVIVTQQ